ncbi:MAG: KilA-N domain-containing protein [Coriobacteriales bacterium]|nr:KilA-N domain-containing protein [Coriobacteriales bacterium]
MLDKHCRKSPSLSAASRFSFASMSAKDGDFISDWLRNRNTVEFLGIWESVHNPDFNYDGFATIRSQAVAHDRKNKDKELPQTS